MISMTTFTGRFTRRAGRVASVAALGLMGLALHGQAVAACMDGQHRQGTPGPAPASDFVPAVYHPEGFGAASLLRVHDRDEDDAGIVGLWQFQMKGFSVDWGTQAWHADGTELMFSGGQNPETGDMCQGVWRKIGPNTYTLNHIAMGWLAPGAGFGLRIHFHVVVKLDRSGNSFTGSYRASVFQETPDDPFDESPSLMVGSGTGTVTATRVQPD